MKQAHRRLHGKIQDLAGLRFVVPLLSMLVLTRLAASTCALANELLVAVRAGDVTRVEVALASRANVDKAYRDGTALHLAATAGNARIAEALIAAGADLEAESQPSDARPSHSAAYNNHREVMALLIDHGAQIDARDNESRTPLMVAALFGNYHTVKLLIARGADPMAKDMYGATALHFAAWIGNIQILTLLLSRCSDVNASMASCGHEKLNVIEFLAAHGADLNVRDKTGKTVSVIDGPRPRRYGPADR